MNNFSDLKIAVAGTGYVGLSIATLLAQHHQVTAVFKKFQQEYFIVTVHGLYQTYS